MNQKYWAADTSHLVEVVEVLGYEKAQKLSGNIGRHIFDWSISAHEDDALRAEVSCEEAGGACSNRSSKYKNVIFWISEASLSLRLENMLHYYSTICRDLFGRAL